MTLNIRNVTVWLQHT